ncbi:hypothetical protein CONCODRAFT_6278 [Conidiobolus coronatus NRRL 28638]|uniref:Uncharacterized protein n=1 Tax=Conidiobolus coronatus (strain ATCC 28846 / CBS 209.66 / NRRL 28638) TaxID=796925 RepID=A0A137P7R7_CONC2|nr:hypothetical protein CONCODRAFT_6278 [Conidiobolus coronatus NRRL 28638]|eukprot:KXN71048.1 hypothetical protein CONCODRAFT_6278 [Conidiobolus coronatus NRRL 28638]
MNIQDFCGQQQNSFICRNELIIPFLNFMQSNQFPFVSPDTPQNGANNPQAMQGMKFPQVPAWESGPQQPSDWPSRRPSNSPQLSGGEHNFGLPKPENKPGILPQLPKDEHLFAPPIDGSSNESVPPGGDEIPSSLSPEPSKESPENEFKFPDFEEIFKLPTQDPKPYSPIEIPSVKPIEPKTGNIIHITDPSNGDIKPPTEDFDKECDIKALESLKGARYKPKTKEFVKKDGKLFEQSALPKLIRVVGPKTMLTMDFVPQRVNINYEPINKNNMDENAEGIVTGFSCG